MKEAVKMKNENGKIRLLHLYYDMMNLYGEYANLLSLKKFIEEKTGNECEIISAENIEKALPLRFDLIYTGAGTEKAQKKALENLVPYARELKSAAEEGTIILFTGNAYEMLGKTVKSLSGESYSCLGFFDFNTEESGKRITGDAVCENLFADKLSSDGEIKKLLENDLTIGFVNKCTEIKWGEDSQPLFKMLFGLGDDNTKSRDGAAEGNIFGTHLIGPLMIKNPHLLKFFAWKIFFNREDAVSADKVLSADTPLESKAYLVSLNELKNRMAQEK